MPKVEIDIPKGWELADKKLRAPKPGEWYLSGNKTPQIKRGLFSNPSQLRVIVKRVEPKQDGDAS